MKNETRVKVTVEHETKKALLISDGSRKGWIQRRWLRNDSSVSEKTFEKAVETFKQRETAKNDERKFQTDLREFKNSWHLIRFTRKTEKAIATTLSVEIAGIVTERLAWFPKSQCAIKSNELAEVPGWLIKAKEAEACENYRGGSYYERHRLCKGEPVFLARRIDIVETN